MEQLDQNSETTSIVREFSKDTISLKELYQKFLKKEIEYKIYVVREDQFPENEAFEIVGILGTGRSCYVFLALVDKKLVSLRMSYEEGDFADKFDSVRVEMEDDYDEYFLRLLYPSVPIDYLNLGSVRKKKKLFFDKKVFASFWEKADATLTMKLTASFESKLKWFGEFLKGLELIHARKRAHFDIKLENLFLVDDRLKIGDFEYYLKIDDFIRSKIHFCGTPGHIAPEMFYQKKKVTTRIDIFSAGSAFARLFTAAEPPGDPDLFLGGEVKLSPQEETSYNSLFKKRQLQQLPNKKVREAFDDNFKRFNFYLSYLQKELRDPGLSEELKKIYTLLLKMMKVNPAARPDAAALVREVEKILGECGVRAEDKDKGILSPVFKISKTPVTVVNLNKKTGIEFGSIKRKEQGEDNSVNDINLRFVDISRRHMRLNYIEAPSASSDDKIEIIDLHSKHGVFLNNKRIEAGRPWELASGDVVQLGSITAFRFTREEGFYQLKNVTQERKKGNLLWMDRKQVKELPDKDAVILLLRNPLYLVLSSYGTDEDTTLTVDESGSIEIKGEPDQVPLSGDIIL